MRKFILALTLAASPALAHMPVLDVSAKTAEAPFVIDDAEHSKAIYAQLDGAPDYYRITEDQPFDFYVGITLAKVEGCTPDTSFSFDVLDAEGNVIESRDGAEHTWTDWFEEFGKQWYWVGPEVGKDFASTTVYPAGTYTIRVRNDGNQGRYVLAVGDDERFGLGALFTIRGVVKETAQLFWQSGC